MTKMSNSGPLFETEHAKFYIQESDMAVMRVDLRFWNDASPAHAIKSWGSSIETRDEHDNFTGSFPVNYEPINLDSVVLVLNKKNPHIEDSNDWWIVLPSGQIAFVDGRYLVPLGHNRSPSEISNKEKDNEDV